MSSKSTKSTTNHPLRNTDSALEAGVCENCEHSVPAGGSSVPILICRHKADTHLPWQVVAPKESCANFEQARELVLPDITDALAEGARLIPLTQDKFAIVDAEDYELLSRYNWYAAKDKRSYYAVRNVKRSRIQIRMHRIILNAPPGLLVDHINHNGLDNRKANLRLCTPFQNSFNQRPRRGTSSEYKGVHFYKRLKKFMASITLNQKRYHLGYFKSEIDAAKAYDRKAMELFGRFAYLNFPEDWR